MGRRGSRSTPAAPTPGIWPESTRPRIRSTVSWCRVAARSGAAVTSSSPTGPCGFRTATTTGCSGSRCRRSHRDRRPWEIAIHGTKDADERRAGCHECDAAQPTSEDVRRVVDPERDPREADQERQGDGDDDCYALHPGRDPGAAGNNGEKPVADGAVERVAR